MELQNIIADYFGQTEHSANINMMGSIALIDITYTDFKPERQVRRDLEELIPMSIINIEQRRYSPQSINKALQSLLSVDCNIIADERQIPIFVYIEEQLFQKDLSI